MAGFQILPTDGPIFGVLMFNRVENSDGELVDRPIGLVLASGGIEL